jgi:hypothetical protein
VQYLGCLALAFVIACGGGTQESSPRTQGSDAPQFVVMQDGKPVWPPVGPGCDAFVKCCNEASPGRPEINLTCQLMAATPDCEAGRKSVVEQLGHNAPASCR